MGPICNEIVPHLLDGRRLPTSDRILLIGGIILHVCCLSRQVNIKISLYHSPPRDNQLKSNVIFTGVPHNKRTLTGNTVQRPNHNYNKYTCLTALFECYSSSRVILQAGCCRNGARKVFYSWSAKQQKLQQHSFITKSTDEKERRLQAQMMKLNLFDLETCLTQERSDANKTIPVAHEHLITTIIMVLYRNID